MHEYNDEDESFQNSHLQQSSLCLSRRVGESIKIGDDVEIKIEKVSGNQVKILFRAPRHIKIIRSELLERGAWEHE